MAKCKRCGLKTALTQSDIDKMVSEVKSMRGVELTDEDTYRKRFGICEECEHFYYKSTCNLCGCVMQVRARLKSGRCPKKKWS